MSLTSLNSLNRERELMALEALHHLSVQFAANQDFEELARLLLLTLSGQFGVPGLLAAVHQPGSPRHQASVVAVGPFRHAVSGGIRPELLQCWKCLENHTSACDGTRYTFEAIGSHGPVCLRREYSVSVVVPLVRDAMPFGFVGLGTKHSGERLNPEEIALLEAIVGMVTPLLLNSYLLLDVRSTKQWYEGLLDSVPQAVFVADANGRLRMMNRSAMRLVPGYARAYTGGSEAPLVAEVLKGIELPASVQQVLSAGGTNIPNGFSVVERTTGRIFNVSIARVANETLGSFDTMLILDDVSQAKKTEMHLLELERLAERGAMVSSIAHEIRNVLAVLRGGVELSQIVLKRGDTEKAETYLTRVLESVRHLDRFAGELVDTKKAQAVKEPGALNDLVTNVVTFLKLQRRFKSVTLVTVLDAEIPPIDMDADQVSQLLLNLLNNAADAIREAGRDEGLITVRTSTDGETVTLSISDNGCGIPDEMRDQLFQRRFTTKKDGHGFGLITCGRIIASHQALLRVETRHGAYTKFEIAFPAVGVGATVS